MHVIETNRVSAELYEVDSLEEAEFIEFTNKLPVTNLISTMRNTYACVSNMSDNEVLKTRVDCNI